MSIRTSWRRAALALVCASIFLLAACGDESGGVAPPVEGGETAQAVVDGLRDAIEKDDVAGFNAYILPEQRALLSFGLAVFPVKRIVELSEAMLPASAAAGPQELMKAKARVEAMKKERAALLSKYAIDLGDEKQPAAPLSGPDAMEKALNETLGHVDHAAFIRESRAFLERHSPGEEKQPPALVNFKRKFGTLTLDGDKATVPMEGVAKPLGLVKRDGRWYADLSTMP